MVAVVLVGRSSLADHYRVPSGSMQPTVHVGDRVLVNKAAYGLRLPGTAIWLTEVSMPRRGDVVVLSSPEDGVVLLKRVVAVAGDQVEVAAGHLRLDGRRVKVEWVGEMTMERLDDNPHPVSFLAGGGPDFGPVRVPAGHLLVVGDNRGNSHDGRSFGFVRGEDLLGRAIGVYWRGGGLSWSGL